MNAGAALLAFTDGNPATLAMFKRRALRTSLPRADDLSPEKQPDGFRLFHAGSEARSWEDSWPSTDVHHSSSDRDRLPSSLGHVPDARPSGCFSATDRRARGK